LIELAWPGDLEERFGLLYAAGTPVQYSYMETPLELWDVQTSFASRPWAVEMPSAARPLRGAILQALRRRGVGFATLTHAAGLSATGDARLDAALPLPEHYDIPEATVSALARTRGRGGRIVAVGTSVVRALEDSAWHHGEVQAGRALATLKLDSTTKPRVASGLLTGIHLPGESHYRLLSAFVAAQVLSAAARLALDHRYRSHEFGDSALFLPGLARDEHAA
jgi:S-adenosylmethionine:tRNA ribosyltransferase-isomerase